MLYDDNTAGQTYELYGPKEYSTAAIAKLVDREIYKKRWHINLPKAILRPLAAVLNRVLYWPVLSAEDVDREFIDQQIDESAKTFADLGITPGDLKDYTYHYLVRDTHPVLRAARWMLIITKKMASKSAWTKPLAVSSSWQPEPSSSSMKPSRTRSLPGSL